jgi:hypothetical protein
VTFDQALAVAQLCLLVINVLMVPLAFTGVRWVISVERRLAEISVKLTGRRTGDRQGGET